MWQSPSARRASQLRSPGFRVYPSRTTIFTGSLDVFSTRIGTMNPDQRADPSPQPPPLGKGRGRIVANPFAIYGSWKAPFRLAHALGPRTGWRRRTRTRTKDGSWKDCVGDRGPQIARLKDCRVNDVLRAAAF